MTVQGIRRKVDKNQLTEYVEKRFGKVAELHLARDNGKLIKLAMKRGKLTAQMEGVVARKAQADNMGARRLESASVYWEIYTPRSPRIIASSPNMRCSSKNPCI